MRLASPSGLITPAGNETLHVKGGMTAGFDLGDLTRGEAGSLVLTASDRSVPVVAAVRVLRGKEGKQETAFIPAARPVETRATALDNTAKGTTLSVTSPEGTAQIKVTASAGTKGGTPATKTYTIKSGTTQDIEAPVPAGVKGTYALTVEPQAGTTVYTSRTLSSTEGGVPFFTVQPLPDDRGWWRCRTRARTCRSCSGSRTTSQRWPCGRASPGRWGRPQSSRTGGRPSPG